jgi:hypothetical protein
MFRVFEKPDPMLLPVVPGIGVLIEHHTLIAKSVLDTSRYLHEVPHADPSLVSPDVET